MKKILLLFSALSVLAVLTVYAKQESNLNANIIFSEDPSMSEVTITQKKEGVVNWILKSEKALFLNSKDIKLDGLEMMFPQKDLVLTSNSGFYDTETKNLKIDGDIKASSKNYEIVTAKLFWDSANNRLVSDAKVRINGKSFFVEGDNMTATTDRAKLDSNVKAVFYGK